MYAFYTGKTGATSFPPKQNHLSPIGYHTSQHASNDIVTIVSWFIASSWEDVKLPAA